MKLLANIPLVATALGVALLCTTASARVFLAGDCIGMVNRYTVKPGESLIELARAFGLGFNEITDANPSVDPFIPPTGADIDVPLAWIVPRVTVQEGIVVNLAEMRLYLFIPGNERKIATFPVGIGEMGKETPLGVFSVIEKITSPMWHVPQSIRAERPELGKTMAAGPDNPLGSHALRLSMGDVLIHGTNKPWGQGRRVSHGCIRLYPEDIRQLYEAVPVGIKVTIVTQAVKIGTRDQRVFAEIHRFEGADHLTEALDLLRQQGLIHRTDLLKLKAAIYRKSGIPVDITRYKGVEHDKSLAAQTLLEADHAKSQAGLSPQSYSFVPDHDRP